MIQISSCAFVSSTFIRIIRILCKEIYIQKSDRDERNDSGGAQRKLHGACSMVVVVVFNTCVHFDPSDPEALDQQIAIITTT